MSIRKDDCVLINQADSSAEGIGFHGICLSVYTHDITKTDAARITTKFDIQNVLRRHLFIKQMKIELKLEEANTHKSVNPTSVIIFCDL